MDTLSSPSAKLTATSEHRREAELRKSRLVLFVLLTADSGLLIYLLWGDLVSVASVGVTYVAGGLLLGRPANGGRQWLGSVICFLLMSLGLLQVSRLARTLAASTPSFRAFFKSAPMLVAAAGAAALVVGGGCAYLLHRRGSGSKEQRQEEFFLPLRQDPRN